MSGMVLTKNDFVRYTKLPPQNKGITVEKATYLNYSSLNLTTVKLLLSNEITISQLDAFDSAC